jgi:predicted dehydrogenase
MDARLRNFGLAAMFASVLSSASIADEPPVKRIGILGAESVHAVAFTELINDEAAEGLFIQFQVVAGYPAEYSDLDPRRGHVPGFDQKMRELGVRLHESVSAVIEDVDFIMVMSNEGQPHLAHALAAMRAGKPLFVDKPIGPTLKEVVAIYTAAEHHDVPIFSSSALRFSRPTQAIAGASLGRVLGADVYSPAPLEPTHTDLFWYGIHGVEPLFTVMGPGCQSVQRVHTQDFDVVVGQWKGGRLGTVRGTRMGPHAYGGTAFGEKGIAPLGGFETYQPLVAEILGFFQAGRPPVSPEATLEIYAFMQAADESKRRGGEAVTLVEVLERARTEAEHLLRPGERP